MDRRVFLRSAAAFTALSAVEFTPWQTVSAFAREVEDFVRGPQVKDHPLRQVSKHVWMIFSPDGRTRLLFIEVPDNPANPEGFQEAGHRHRQYPLPR